MPFIEAFVLSSNVWSKLGKANFIKAILLSSAPVKMAFLQADSEKAAINRAEVLNEPPMEVASLWKLRTSIIDFGVGQSFMALTFFL